jgi:hypothetical protein
MAAASAFTWFPPELVFDDEQFVVHSGYTILLLRYVTRAANKPYIATLCGASGRNMLEDGPADHAHHHGVWWGHGDVNGVDYYLELPGGDGPPHRGRIEHVRWSAIVDDAPRFGFTEDLVWRDHRCEPVITEQRSVHLSLASDAHYTVDLSSSYLAEQDLVFGDTKESVLPGIRPAETMTGLLGGTITSSRGRRGEADTFGQPAEWVDVSAARRVQYLGEEVVEGIACFDHPSNPGHPQRWFTREYGPFSPFEGHHFHDDRRLSAGTELRLRHRIVVHRDDATGSGLDDLYRAYCEEDVDA